MAIIARGDDWVVAEGVGPKQPPSTIVVEKILDGRGTRRGCAVERTIGGLFMDLLVNSTAIRNT